MKNKALALRLLAEDCEIEGEYYRKGKTCAIGCLAKAAGVSNETLKDAQGIYIESIYNEAVMDIANAIKKKFGLMVKTMRKIQAANDDSHETVIDRRKAVLKLVRKL